MGRAGDHFEESRQTDTDYLCCILGEARAGEHAHNSIALRLGLTPEEQHDACRAAAERFVRISEHGPDVDGWQLRSDGDYQLWLRLHYFGTWLPEHQ